MAWLLTDIRFALRVLLKNRAFTAAALATLALGIGANTLVFSVVNTVLLEPLPYDHADRLVQIWETSPVAPAKPVTPANFVDVRDRTRVFDAIGLSRDATYNLTGDGRPEMVIGYRFSANFLDVMGARPALGRFFRPDEEQPGRDHVAVLSDALWRRRFGGDRGIIGQSITMNAEPYTVVGVMGPEFKHPQDTEIWTPLSIPPERFADRSRSFLRLVARLKPGVSVAEARAAVAAVGDQLKREYPETNAEIGVTLESLRDARVGDVRPALLILLAVVGFLLLAACANVGSLFLARALDRRQEIAVRLALGASRRRLVAQLMTESLVLSLAGGILGLLVAAWGTDWMVTLFPKTISNLSIPRLERIPIDVRVLGFTLGASILTGIIFGLVPALQSSVANLSPSARAAEKGGEGGRGGRLRGGLVSVQVALALVLLVAAGLLTRSFIRVNSGDIGFKAENVLTLRLLLSDARKYAKPAQWRTFQERAVEAVAAVPGVETVGTTTTLPLSGWWGTVAYQIVGRAPAPAGREPEADNRVADPGYFRAMGLRLIRGRFFDTSDRDSTERVVLINETLARKEWKEGDPVGSYLEILGGRAAERYRIAGVVNDVKHFGLDTDTHAEIYRPFAQQPSSLVSLTIKTRRDPMAVADPVRRAIWRVDAEQPVSYVMAMEQLTAEALAPRRVSTLFVSLFALVVLALSAIGTYGLLASVVSRRTREIGVRMALGADRGRVVRVVLGHALLFVGIGVGVGLVTAIGLVRLMESVLFGVSATDPLTFVAVPAAIVLTALVSALVPAWRAASIDPAIALRYE